MSAVPRMPVMVTIPAISILHLSQSTRDMLCEPLERPYMVASHDNGFFLSSPACQETEDGEWLTIPVDLRAVFNYMAIYSQFGWMMLDVDGDIVDGLPLGDDHEEPGPFLRCYDCPSCGHNWESVGASGRTEDCPACGNDGVYPVSSNEI